MKLAVAKNSNRLKTKIFVSCRFVMKGKLAKDTKPVFVAACNHGFILTLRRSL